MHQARCLPGEAFEEGNPLLPRTGFQLQQKTLLFHRSSVSCANSSGHVFLTPTHDAACSFVSSRLCVPRVECIWSAKTGFGSHRDDKRSRPPSSTVLDVLSTVSARAGNRSTRVSWFARFTRVRSKDLSTQLRRTRASSTVSPPVPTTVADPNQSLKETIFPL